MGSGVLTDYKKDVTGEDGNGGEMKLKNFGWTMVAAAGIAFLILVALAWASLAPTGVSRVGTEDRIDGSLEDDLCARSEADSRYVNQRIKYLSIPGTAFLPRYAEYDYTRRSGRICTNNTSHYIYYAPMFLPHNATVTGLYYYFYDYSSSYDTLVELHRCYDTGIRDLMARCSSSGTPGNSSCSDIAIDYATVNDAAYSYIVWLHLPSTCSDMKAYRVAVRYTES